MNESWGIDSLLTDDLSSFAKEMIIVQKQHAICMAYIHRGQGTEAKGIAASCLSKAIKVQLVDCVIDFCKILTYYYSVISPNKGRAIVYEEMYQEYIVTRRVEEEMASIYSKFMLVINSKKSSKFEETILARILNLMCIRRNYHIAIRGYVMLATYYRVTGDEDAVIEYCKDALSYFESSVKLSTNTPRQVFALQALPLLIKHGRHEEAFQIILDNIPDKKTHNYFKFIQFKFISLIRQQKHGEALQLYKTIGVSGSYKGFSEEWRIAGAYNTALMELSGYVFQDDFKIGRFFNQIEVFSQDKSGHNVHLIILEILFRYARNEVKIHDRTSSFKAYALRHTRKGGRDRAVINGLVKWVDRSFEYDFKQELQTLKSTEKREVDVEIIDYEWLLSFLQEKSSRA